MDLRTITINLGKDFNPSDRKNLLLFDNFKKKIKADLKKQNVKVRTFRINLYPITYDEKFNAEKTFGYLEEINRLCNLLNIRWFNIPFNVTKNSNTQIFDFAKNCMKRFDKSFINFIVSDDNNINFAAVRESSRFIKENSLTDITGFNNFRVGISCNPKRNTPFFPFSYSGENLNFSIGLEMVKEINILLNNKHYIGSSLMKLRELIMEKLSIKISTINEICQSQTIMFVGTDFSLAPYPEKNGSVAQLIESLSIDTFGNNGTLFLTSFLTDILKTLAQRFPNVGFNGVMYSLLEDAVMGQRNKGFFSIDSLISYSTVCGCGVDMIPVPGNIYVEEISSIILDIHAISTKLNKPLGIRILPIPYKEENELTMFCMDFLFNTRVMKIKNSNCLLDKEMFCYNLEDKNAN